MFPARTKVIMVIACGVGIAAGALTYLASRSLPQALLTAVAAMLGALFILDDPIFNGLAISLLFGIFVSTLLTLVVIPVLYYAVNQASARAKRPADAPGETTASDSPLPNPQS